MDSSSTVETSDQNVTPEKAHPTRYRRGELFLLLLQPATALLIFLVTCLYAFFAYSQWRTMQQQWRTMGEQTNAMRGQVAAMQDQLRVMQDQASSMREGVRPFLSIEPIDSDEFEGRQKEITLTIVNNGNGPAKDVRTRYGFVVASTPPSECGAPDSSSETIQPHEQVPTRMKVDGALIEQLKNPNMHLFLCGKVSYSGVGGSYELKLCRVWRPDYHAFSDCSMY